MRKLLFFLLFPMLFACNREPEIKSEPGIRLTSYKQLLPVFQNPTAEYRTAPFWVWNNKVTRDDIDRTLTEYKDKGMGGVFLHPRYGMITEYLSDEWWELVQYSLQKAEELDLNLWIYDENSYPSGFAGGHVPAQMPESNSEGIRLEPYFLSSLKNVEIERIRHIFKKEGETWKEIIPGNGEETGTTGEYCVLALEDYPTSKWFADHSYVDLLKPGVTQKFMEITMSGYEKTLGAEFGRRVPGVFTDEPNTNTRSSKTIRYTSDLYEQFEKLWGYRLEENLMSLITETGDWKKVRHNYQSSILYLFIERWSKPWYEYTESKGLLWTGHYWEHGWPSPQEGPDNMAMYAWHQQPAIDLLFNAEDLRPDQFGNVRNVKELSSVANQFGRHRTLSETYGGAGWELTFDDMKRLGDWEYVLGVNFMNQHLAFMSLAGDRKHDYPQSFGPHNPNWGLYRYQADYFARLSAALSSGFQHNKILVIEPTTTAWMYYNPTGENADMKAVKQKFEPFLDNLEKWQVEYDLGCENIIRNHGRVEKNRFVVNQASYEKVILPPGLENVDKATFELLKSFVEAGGEIWQVAATPGFVDGVETSFASLQSNKNWKIFDDADREVFAGLSVNEKISFVNPDSIRGKVFHQRREFDDGQLLFLTNFHKIEAAEVNVQVSGKSVTEMNAENGSIWAFPFRKENGMVDFSVQLPPSGSKLLFISYKNKKGKSPKTFGAKELFPTGETTVTTVTPNILTLDYLELTMGKFRNEPLYFYDADNEIWKHHGFPDNPWSASVQFKTRLADADTFAVGSGFTVCYPFFVDENFELADMQLVVERPNLYQISVNGQPVQELEDKYWLDPDFRIFEIGQIIKKGRNEVVLTASPFSMYCETEPLYLLGNFAVLPQEKGWKLANARPLATGAWKNQGMPFYGQTVSYTKKVQVKVESRFLIELPEWKGTVAEVLVDGKHQGIIFSKPYELEVSIPYGIHEITVNVTGSNKNTLGPHHNYTTPGIVSPGSFRTAPQIQPSGESYDLLDYGLIQDFMVYELKKI